MSFGDSDRFEPPPSPPWVYTVSVPAVGEDEFNFAILPKRPGVFVFEDERGGTIAMASTANLRRMIRDRLAPPDTEDGPKRRIDYRNLVATIRALTVGSAFEADWAYLQHARQRTPNSAAVFAERNQPWFVHCDPETTHPRWVKTAHPGRPPTGRQGVYVGPFARKRSARQYIEMLEDAFDLCRYHHILVQAPHGNACAYKDMGKCPAPCDGSVSMSTYKSQIDDSIRFARSPVESWRAEIESHMHAASESHDFERAACCRRLLDATEPATRRDCAHAADLNDFAYLAVMPAEREHTARLFVIRGGWIEPFVDIQMDCTESGIEAALERAHRRVESISMTIHNAMLENIGIVCRHLLQPKRKPNEGSFLRLDKSLRVDEIRRAVRALQFRRPPDDKQSAVQEQFFTES